MRCSLTCCRINNNLWALQGVLSPYFFDALRYFTCTWYVSPRPPYRPRLHVHARQLDAYSRKTPVPPCCVASSCSVKHLSRENVCVYSWAHRYRCKFRSIFLSDSKQLMMLQEAHAACFYTRTRTSTSIFICCCYCSLPCAIRLCITFLRNGSVGDSEHTRLRAGDNLEHSDGEPGRRLPQERKSADRDPAATRRSSRVFSCENVVRRPKDACTWYTTIPW